MSTICPLVKRECGHCSMEQSVTGVFTKLKKNPVTHMFDPAGRGTNVIKLGEFCNNDGRHFVRDLNGCPNDFIEDVPRPVKVEEPTIVIPSTKITNTNKILDLVKAISAKTSKEVEANFRFRVSLQYSEDMPDYKWACAGIAYPSLKVIILNRDFIELNLADHYHVVEFVMKHELIHLKLPSGEGHGKLFKETCVKYGFHPRSWPANYVGFWWKKGVHGRERLKNPPRVEITVS